jgi:hypothetical protein
MHSMKKQAKLDLLKDLRKMAMGMINSDEGEEMPEHMQKVMVAAKDKEGLEAGLDKAKQVLESSEEMEEDSEDSEMPELESDEDSPEALKAKIKELQAKLEQSNK